MVSKERASTSSRNGLEVHDACELGSKGSVPKNWYVVSVQKSGKNWQGVNARNPEMVRSNATSTSTTPLDSTKMTASEREFWMDVMEAGKGWNTECGGEEAPAPLLAETKPKTVDNMPNTMAAKFVAQTKALDLALERSKRQRELINGGPNVQPDTSLTPPDGLAMSWIHSKINFSAAELYKIGRAHV